MNTKTIVLLLIGSLIYLLYLPSSQGSTYYISANNGTSPNNSNCKATHPCKSLAQVLDLAKKGDTIKMDYGVYSGSENRNLTLLFDLDFIGISSTSGNDTVLPRIDF